MIDLSIPLEIKSAQRNHYSHFVNTMKYISTTLTIVVLCTSIV